MDKNSFKAVVTFGSGEHQLTFNMEEYFDITEDIFFPILGSMSPEEVVEFFDSFIKAGISADCIADGYIAFCEDDEYTDCPELLDRFINAHVQPRYLLYYFGDEGYDIEAYFEKLLAHGYKKDEIFKGFAEIDYIDHELIPKLLRLRCNVDYLISHADPSELALSFDFLLSAGADADSILKRIGYFPIWYIEYGIAKLLEKGADARLVLNGLIEEYLDFNRDFVTAITSGDSGSLDSLAEGLSGYYRKNLIFFISGYLQFRLNHQDD